MIDQAHMDLVMRLDTTKSGEQEVAWDQIKASGMDIPHLFRKAYPLFKKWQGRRDLLFHCIRHARTSEDAFQLALAAINDRATLVRYRAACVLAYSLRREAIPFLQEASKRHDEETGKDCERAILAIRNQDHHLFMADRADSWIVNAEEDRAPRKKNIIDTLKGLFQ